MKKIIGSLLVFICLVFMVCSSAKNEETIKTWKIPDYMIENLNYMVNDFNQRFEAKVAQFKNDLQANFKGYEDLLEDAILDLKNGVFIDRTDYIRLQQEAVKRQQEANKEKEKK